MKTYKHKKTGEIATYQDGILKSSGFSVEIGIEPSSEFWEEVVEKNYEIIELITNVHGRKSNVQGYGEEYLQALLKDTTNVKIHSVKRLSDGEIFTVGDVCNPITDKYKNNSHSITNFELIFNNTTFRVGSKNWYLDIESIEKSKPFLFTTEDGVDIYEGADCWSVFKDTLKLGGKVDYKNKHPYNIVVYFSTKEKAEEYILMNKPCLSINDVAKVYKTANQFPENKPNSQGNLLKELVKSKL